MVPRGLVSAKRIKEVLIVEPSLKNKEHPLQPKETLKGQIVYEDVSFSYPNTSEKCFRPY